VHHNGAHIDPQCHGAFENALHNVAFVIRMNGTYLADTGESISAE
jgi:predicted nucleic acid-binding Zn ribbon protein